MSPLKLLLVLTLGVCLAEVQTIQGSHQTCVGNRLHQLDFKATTESNKFVDLDGMTSLLESVSCDIDHTQLQLNFKHRTDAIAWVVKFHDLNNHFIVGGKQWNCSTVLSTDKSRPSMILRRVVGASESEHLGKTLFITTAIARYDEVFSDAEIGFGGVGRDCEVSKPVCLGYNTDCSGSASSSLPLYSGSHVTVTCSDCYAALDADVFVNISIHGFKLASLAGGFQNVNFNSSVVFDAQAQAQWGLALDKTLQLVSNTYLLDFKVGSVPFMLWFDVTAEAVGDLSFNTAGELTLGAKAAIGLGDAYASWTPDTHWTHSKMTFQPEFTPELSTKASMDLTGSMAIKPLFEMHFDRIFSYYLNTNPTIQAEVSGSEAEKQVCLSSNFNMDVTATTDLDINIPIVNFHKDWKWGPSTVASWSDQVIPKTCVPL